VGIWLAGGSAVSNVLGTINPVSRIIESAHARGAKVLLDAAQSASHLPLGAVLRYPSRCNAVWISRERAASTWVCFGPRGADFFFAEGFLEDDLAAGFFLVAEGFA